eukprot:SAG31_NODE_2967_length_4841_cov_4.952552_5_plen_117_part_00
MGSAGRSQKCKGRYCLVFVQLFEKYGTLIERNAALIEKVSPCRALDSVGAIGPDQTRRLSDAEAYTFGTRVAASAMAPGDILHFRDCRLEYEEEAVKDGKRGTMRVRTLKPLPLPS